MTAPVLVVVNCGSSSIKFSVYSTTTLKEVSKGRVMAIGVDPWCKLGDAPKFSLPKDVTLETSFLSVLEWLMSPKRNWDIQAFGHRVVHGGTEFSKPVVVNRRIILQLRALTPLAPLHQPYNVFAMEAIAQQLPKIPQVACFDTSFHTTQNVVETLLAIPRRYRDEGVRKYGFHGLSYERIATVLKQKYAKLARGKVVVAHLGNGASMCAMKNGQSVATTMGMTAVDGLPMGTRSGALDAGAVLHMIRNHNMTPHQLEKMLYKQSGLLGLSEVSSDMQVLLASKDKKAKMAVEYFVHRCAQFVGYLSVSLGGLDAVVFTGGIGENSKIIRNMIVKKLAHMKKFKVLTIPTDEELQIAQHTRALLATAQVRVKPAANRKAAAKRKAA